MDHIILRDYQEDAVNRALLCEENCTIKMFCGLGKSVIMKTVSDRFLADKENCTVVFVLPWLSLIDQFIRDYFKKDDIILRVSSGGGTTDKDTIETFLEQECNKIILVTYASLELLESCYTDAIDLVFFDESHHANFEEDQLLNYNKAIYLSATPNAEPDIIYDYPYLRGAREGYLNPFEIHLGFAAKDNYIYKSMAYTMLQTGNMRVLTFHSDVDTDRENSVNNFVDVDIMITAFKEVINEHFPEKIIPKITFKSLSAKNTPPQRSKILKDMENTPDGEVYIISSCNTIGEGIDTKACNMCVFVDPKSSHVQIIQNIGRIVRKQKNISTVLIPCYVDKEKYAKAKSLEECNEIIKDDLTEGKFITILNVLSTLKNEDVELFEQYTTADDEYSSHELKSAIKCVEVDELPEGVKVRKVKDNIKLKAGNNYFICKDKIYKVVVDKDTEIKVNKKSRIKLNLCDGIETLWHFTDTENLMKNNVIDCTSRYNLAAWRNMLSLCDTFICENGRRPVGRSKNINEKKMGSFISNQLQSYKKSTGVLSIPEYREKWKTFVNKHKKYFLDNIEVWKQKIEKVDEYIRVNGKKPSSTSKNPEVKTLGEFLSTCKKNYEKQVHIMENLEIKEIYEDFIEKHKELFQSNEETWKQKLEKVEDYIRINRKRPSNYSKDPEIKTLGSFLQNCKTNYEKQDNIMKNPEIKEIYEDFIEKYKELFQSNEEIWKQNLKKVEEYIKNTGIRPSHHSKDPEIKTLGGFLGTCKTKYEKQTKIMKIPEIRKLYENFIEKHKELFQSNEENWRQKLEKVEVYIRVNGNKPLTTSKDPEIKTLGQFLGHCKTNYEKQKNIMKDPEIKKLYENFIEKHKELFQSNEENWKQKLEKVEDYIRINGKRPPNTSEDPEIKTLGQFLGTCKQNYEKQKEIMKNPEIRELYENFILKYPKLFTIPESLTKKDSLNEVITFSENWLIHFPKLEEYIEEHKKLPTKEEYKFLASFVKYSRRYFISQEFAFEDETVRDTWEKLIKKYPDLFTEPTVKPTVEPENKTEVKPTVEPQIEPKNKFSDMTSQELFQHFKKKRSEWYKYHEDNQDDKEFIVDYINNKKTKHTLHIADLGCGIDLISEKCKNYKFLNFDYVSSNSTVKECDITKTPLDDESIDIVILHKSLWGSNKEDYIKEAHRILEDNGSLLLTGNIEGKKITELGFMIKTTIKLDSCTHFRCIKI